MKTQDITVITHPNAFSVFRCVRSFILQSPLILRSNNVDRTFNGFPKVDKDQIENQLSIMSADLMAYLCNLNYENKHKKNQMFTAKKVCIRCLVRISGDDAPITHVRFFAGEHSRLEHN